MSPLWFFLWPILVWVNLGYAIRSFQQQQPWQSAFSATAAIFSAIAFAVTCLN